MATGGISVNTTQDDGNVGYSANPSTYINITNTVNSNGTLTRWSFKVGSWGVIGGYGLYVKLKVFRSNGTNYDFVAETGYVNASSNNAGDIITSACSIAVLSGDIIGITIKEYTGYVACKINHPFEEYSLDSDPTTTTAKSAWTHIDFGKLLFGASDLLFDVYINSSTGNNTNSGSDSSNPVQTFDNAYTTKLAEFGGAIHVLNNGADFSSETVTLNKSFSIDLNGSAGNFYMPKAS